MGSGLLGGIASIDLFSRRGLPPTHWLSRIALKWKQKRGEYEFSDTNKLIGVVENCEVTRDKMWV